jgi:hypothetical protein
MVRPSLDPLLCDSLDGRLTLRICEQLIPLLLSGGIAAMAKGCFRDGAFAYVDYGGAAPVEISRALYRERGYDPPLEMLPTKAKYEALRRID